MADESSDFELKEVIKTWGPAEAEVIRSYLGSNGIPCVFRGLVVQSVHPFSADGLGEVRIMVRASDYEVAKKLLENR